MTWTVLRTVFVGWTSIWGSLMLFSWLDWGVGFWSKEHRAEVLSHHVPGGMWWPRGPACLGWYLSHFSAVKLLPTPSHTLEYRLALSPGDTWEILHNLASFCKEMCLYSHIYLLTPSLTYMSVNSYVYFIRWVTIPYNADQFLKIANIMPENNTLSCWIIKPIPNAEGLAKFWKKVTYFQVILQKA